MAPHKTPKNSKVQQHASPVDDTVRPPMVSQPSETYEKAQEDEREVLKAVFMDDYEESAATGAWSVSFLVRSIFGIGTRALSPVTKEVGSKLPSVTVNGKTRHINYRPLLQDFSRTASEGLHGLVSGCVSLPT